MAEVLSAVGLACFVIGDVMFGAVVDWLQWCLH